ncbi:MAG TPA: hypothetical protein [Caudoviricetes sp.]|nr:MAG TPA: hypothetical protein [Caudoviricetes sp.]
MYIKNFLNLVVSNTMAVKDKKLVRLLLTPVFPQVAQIWSCLRLSTIPIKSNMMNG